MTENRWIQGDFRNNLPDSSVSLMIADPVYQDQDMIDDVVSIAVTQKIPSCIFMFPSNLCDLKHKPDQICHWIKQPSTKNTCKKYSNFVEVIACYNVKFYESLHWTNRCGIFTDALFCNKKFKWKKPDSLIERLIRNHYSGSGIVYDPCAGSGTTHQVCKKLGIPSICVEIESKWNINKEKQ